MVVALAVAVVVVSTVMSVAPAVREMKNKTWVPLALILATGALGNSYPAVMVIVVVSVSVVALEEVIVAVSVIEKTALLVNSMTAHLVLIQAIGVQDSLSLALIAETILEKHVNLGNLAVLMWKTSGNAKAALMKTSLLALMAVPVVPLMTNPLVNAVVGLQIAGEAVIVV
jgi:hypothetical protein